MTTFSCNSGTPTEFKPHQFCVEASSIGIPPGIIPRRIETDLGNGLPFIFRVITKYGVLIYDQSCGCVELHVLND